jgi:antitoxin HicB
MGYPPEFKAKHLIDSGHYREGQFFKFNAAEVLTLCLEQRMLDGDAIPDASAVEGGHWIQPTASVQAALLLRKAREQQGKSLADVALALHTSWSAAQRLELANNNPTLRQLERAAAALGKRLIVEMT